MKISEESGGGEENETNARIVYERGQVEMVSKPGGTEARGTNDSPLCLVREVRGG